MINMKWLNSDVNELSKASRLLFASKCVLVTVDFIYGAVYIILMNNNGLSPIEISFIFSISTIALFVFDFPTGAISDKFGRKKVAGIGIIIWGLSLIAFLYARNFSSFLICELILQLGIALVSGNFQTWFYELSKKYDQEEFRKSLLIKLGVIVQVFSIIGSAVGSLILLVGVNVLYTISGVIMLALGVICLLKCEDNHSINSENKNVIKHMLSTTKEFVTSPFTRKLIPFEFFMTFSIFSFILGWQLYFLNYLKLPASYIGILLIVFMMCMLGGRKFSGILHDRNININTIIIVSFISIFLGFIIMFAMKNIIGFIFSAFLIEFGIGQFKNIEEIWLIDIIPSENISSFYSGVGTIDEIFIFVLSISIGLIIEWASMQALWGLSAVMMFVNILYFNFCISKIEKSDVKAEEYNEVLNKENLLHEKNDD